MQGTVKTFNSEKGFGFISRPGAQDVSDAIRTTRNDGLYTMLGRGGRLHALAGSPAPN